MILKYKKGDVLTRIMWKGDKFTITKYEALNDSTTMPMEETSVIITLKMIHTNDEYEQLMGAEKTDIYISATFTDDGIEERTPNLGDLFIIGDKEETINKAKAIILIEHNKPFREEYLRKRRLRDSIKYSVRRCNIF